MNADSLQRPKGRVSRRRVISIVAAAGAELLALSKAGAARATEPRTVTWRGVALGAEARIEMAHPQPETARRLILECVRLTRKYEAIFSLYRKASAITHLNRDGLLRDPPADFVHLLRESQRINALTDGAFDPTVQPVWRLYERTFGHRGARPPEPSELARARSLVGLTAVRVADDLIAFARRDMAVTLNGIAQGYITDRVTDHLRRRGIESVLVDIGEIRSLGAHPSGRSWRVGVSQPRDRRELIRVVSLDDRAIATSGGIGTPFDRDGLHHHLFDPRTGESPNHYQSVSVIAPTAAEADALSTAVFVLPPDVMDATIHRFSNAGAIVMYADGTIRSLGKVI